MRTIPRLTRYTSSDWLLVIEAWFELLCAAIVIQIPFGRKQLLQRAMSTGAITRPTGRVDAIQTAAIVRALSRGRRFHPKTMNCLERSLALVWMLRRRGLAGSLQIGCRRDGRELRFHAWVAGPTGTPMILEETETPFAPFTPVSCESGATA